MLKARHKAVFLDRDGVINKLVLNPKTQEYEAPSSEADFLLFPNVLESLRLLPDLGYKLFLVSNQPDYAKGKTTLENLINVHKKMHSLFLANDIKFTEYYYCYHHPQGVIPEYSIACECRKPRTLFLRQAMSQYSLDLSVSWMIGDRDSDIDCGQSVGTKTILIEEKHSLHKRGQSRPDYKANNLLEAVNIVKEHSEL